MQRYHRSFIGLMEKGKDGEWVKYTEVCAEVKELYKAKHKVIRTLEKVRRMYWKEEGFYRRKIIILFIILLASISNNLSYLI
ncbi:MAG: hypothetical protein DRQ89_12780 [Epsilonproteobacteria bacterium]|nr:MAG: hypothetical protein DRQ89_12780 [Campylobacterota bacterium]